jgi:hypothetical protein
MQVFKFFLGIILVQIITVVLFTLSSADLKGMGLLQLIVPLFFISLIVAFWFNSLTGYDKRDTVEKMKDSFAKEREEIRVKAEKNIAKEAKVTHAKANFKVGATFAGVLGVGVLFVFAQMTTATLLTLTAAGGVASGYYYRGKRLSKREAELKLLEIIEVKAIEKQV